MHWNLYTALETVRSQTADLIEKFAAVFADEDKQGNYMMYILLDIVSLGYAGIAAPLWNRSLKRTDFSKKRPDDYATLKDLTNDVTYQGITLAKDLIAANEDSLETDALLKNSMTTIAKMWEDSIVDHSRWLFGGSDEAVEMLGKMIANGKMISGRIELLDATEQQDMIKHSIYAALIPMAWRFSQRDLNPL